MHKCSVDEDNDYLRMAEGIVLTLDPMVVGIPLETLSRVSVEEVSRQARDPEAKVKV